MERGRAAGPDPADGARPRKPRRLWRRCVLLLVAVVVATVTIALLALGTAPGRRAVLGWVSDTIEERAGVSITVDDFSLALLDGVLQIEGLQLRAAEPGAAPFVTVPRVRAAFRWGELLGDLIVIDAVQLERPHVDVEAPVPRFDAGKPQEDDRPGRTIEIREIVLRGGTIRGTLPETWDVLGDAWSSSGVELRASWSGDMLRVSELAGRLRLDGAPRPAVLASLAARLTLDRDALLDIEALELTAGGLTLETRLVCDLAAQVVSELRFALDAEPAELFPDLASGGHLVTSGVLAIEDARVTGSLRAQVERFPAELLSPLLDTLELERLDPAGSWIDVDADLAIEVALATDLPLHKNDSFVGHADVAWLRPEDRLVTAAIRAVSPAETFGIAFDAELLPDDPGRRHVEGLLTAPSWLELADGRLRETRFTVDLPNLGDAARRLGLGDRDIGGWRPAGELRATGAAAGPLLAPRIDLFTRWSRNGARLLELTAATQISDIDSPTHLTFDVSLLPDSPGRRHAAGELQLSAWDDLEQGALSNGRIELNLPNVADALEEVVALSAELFPGLPIAGRIPQADWLRGRFLADVSASGSLTSPTIDGTLLWNPAAGQVVRLAIHGSVAVEQPFLAGTAALDVERLDVAQFLGEQSSALGLQGRIDGALRFSSESGAWTADLGLESRDLQWGNFVFDRLEVSARGDAHAVEISRIEGTFRDAVGTTESRLAGHAGFAPAWLPTTAELELEIVDPVAGIERAQLSARLEDGILHVDPLELTVQGVPAILHAELPLGSLSPELAARLGSGSRQPIRIRFDNMELATLLSFAPQEEPLPLRGSLDGSLQIDPTNVLASSGTLQIHGLAFGTGEEIVESDATLRLDIEQGRLVLQPTSVGASGPLIGGRAPLRISGELELATDWNPEDGLSGLIRELAFEFAGSVDAGLLKRYVAADHAVGRVLVEATARGRLDALTAEIHVQGPDARLTYRGPYPAMIEAPDVLVRIEGDKVTLERATGRINHGALDVRGELDLATGSARMRAVVGEARFRVDYGLVVVLDADLEFAWSSGRRGRLSGTAVVQRGVLRRDLLLDREVLRMLAESSIVRSDNPLLERVDLDLRIDTAEGVSIKNNVADIHVNWGRLEVGGTMAEPTLDGRIDVDPGGWLWILGQTWRVEEVALDWNGGAIVEGRVVFEATSSAQDPSLKQKSRGFWYAGLGDEGPGKGGGLDFWGQATGQSMEQATADLATYYQNRLAGALGTGLSTQLSYEPLPLLGETDNQARFTVAQQLSPNFTFIASSNPRDAEAQTYIADLRGVPPGPGFRTQLFTNDIGNEGVTLQQTLLLGGGSGIADPGPLLASTIVDIPAGVKARRVKRNTGYRKGEPFPEGAGLDVEVDVVELMGRKGYPSADVEVVVETVKDREVHLRVAVEPGPYVRYEFEGAKLPRAARRDIAAMYRPEAVGTAASLESVIAETLRVSRGLGYLDPQVEARVETDDDGQLLLVTTRGGRKIEPGPLRIEGIPEPEAARIAARRFATLGARVELAAGVESADRRLLRALRDLGWPEASLKSRELSLDGELLTLRVEPGRRQHVVSIEFTGTEGDEAERLAEIVPLAVGDAADSERIVLASRIIEDDLRGRGHVEARVRTSVAPVATDDPFELGIHFEVDRGADFRLADVRFDGFRASKRKWVERTAGLEPGGVLRLDDVAEARRRLYQTGVFKRIDVTTSEDGNDAVVTSAGDVRDTTVTFDLQESRRYQLSYGGRYESDRGFSGVVDFVDTHSLGRGQTSGVRLIYGEEKKRLRLYHMIPRIVGQRSTLELFVEGRDDVEELANVEGIEGWAQLTFPVAGHQMRTYAVVESRDVTPLDPDVPVDDLVLSPRFGWQAVFSGLDNALGVTQRKGTFVGLDISGSSQALGSDASSIAAFAQFKWFLPFRWFSWAQSWRSGVQEAFEEEIPFVDRLRAGGEFSVRGYPTNSLGPLDANGVSLGGEVLFVVNQELHRSIWRSLHGLVFFDAGNVWLDRDSLDSDLFKSAGFGLRYASPVGPLRLDVGFPLDRRPDDPEYQIYFGFGTVF